MKKIPAVLLILDGCGQADPGPGNAVANAATPNLDALFAAAPHTQLSASGLDVGLPEGQIGNSEVGHTNIGAGRVVYQDLPRISAAVADGSFFENRAYLSAADHAAACGQALHLMGLLSDGGVHSHITHLEALLELARRRGVERVYIHAFLDGRDVSPESGAGYLRRIEETCRRLGTGRISTVQGRFYAMDRDSRWDRLQRGYDALVRGAGKAEADPAAAVEAGYAAGVTDEFAEPVICDPAGIIRPGDSVIFFNFRPDRAREITRALTEPEFPELDREPELDLTFVCTTEYDAALRHVLVAFPPEDIRGTLGEYIAGLGRTQLRIAETEKYAHVTFFFNGGREQPFPGEDRILVPSPRDCATYDLMPEMSAREVAEKMAAAIRSGHYDLVIGNLANCDMVGHTGVYAAAVQAVETVDVCVGLIVEAVRDAGSVCLITADHGNADCMLRPDGGPHTAHTTNPVPLIVAGADVRLRPGRLADIAPTLLDLMGLALPPEMSGTSLIEN